MSETDFGRRTVPTESKFAGEHLIWSKNIRAEQNLVAHVAKDDANFNMYG